MKLELLRYSILQGKTVWWTLLFHDRVIDYDISENYQSDWHDTDDNWFKFVKYCVM